jgi:hypothetical protein
LARFEHGRSLLKDYPDILEALFTALGDQIPVDFAISSPVQRDNIDQGLKDDPTLDSKVKIFQSSR